MMPYRSKTAQRSWYIYPGLLPLIAAVLFSGACVKLALRMSPSIFGDFSTTFLKECDPELARDALPGQLKLAEALLNEDPENKAILRSLCIGYTGYALLFVEPDDPERASQLYHRALAYGLSAMGIQGGGGQIPNTSILSEKLELTDCPTAFWTSVAWLRWIDHNLDDPEALAQIPLAIKCLKKVIATDPGYFYGAPYAIMGSIVASRPHGLAGNLASAKRLFEKALRLSDGRLYLVQFLYARYYAVAKQDRSLFQSLLESITGRGAIPTGDVCLINQVMKRRAKELLEKADDLFI